jgi:pimeloyl-ACP methyl ester carboxylesterase
LGDFRADGRAVHTIGSSMGGGIALAMAGETPGIGAVVGDDIDAHWRPWGRDGQGSPVRHPNRADTPCPRSDAPRRQTGRARASVRGTVPDMPIARITAPVLRLQRTGDRPVLWQTTRALANRLGPAAKTVRFVLYAGGERARHTVPDQAESGAQILAWF